MEGCSNEMIGAKFEGTVMLVNNFLPFSSVPLVPTIGINSLRRCWLWWWSSCPT